MTRVGAAVAAALLMAATAAAAPQVRGDRQAWQDLLAAYGRLQALRSYRMEATATASADRMRTEYARPDRWHTVTTTGTVTTDTIAVGRVLAQRAQAGGPWSAWTCDPAPRGWWLHPWIPAPAGLPGQVVVRRLGRATVGGAATEAYLLDWRDQDTQVRIRAYVRTDRGLLHRAEVLDARGTVAVAARFEGYDAPLTIVLPKCRA